MNCMPGYTVEYLSSSNEREWDESLEKLRGGSFYHTTHWQHVLEDAHNLTSRYFFVRDAKGIAALCPFFEGKIAFFHGLLCLPSSDNCCILLRESNPALLETIYSECRRICKARSLSFFQITTVDPEVSRSFWKWNPLPLPVLGTMQVDLGSTRPEQIWSSFFSKKDRDQIIYCKNHGFTVRRGDSDDLKSLYDMYRSNLAHQKIESYPYSHFESIRDVVGEDRICITMLTKDGVKIAGSLAFKWAPNRALYGRYLGVDRKALAQSCTHCRVSHFLQWDLIERASKTGYKTVCLGSTPNSLTDRYYRQKRKFGGKYEKNYAMVFPLSHAFTLCYNAYNRLNPDIWRDTGGGQIGLQATQEIGRS